MSGGLTHHRGHWCRHFGTCYCVLVLAGGQVHGVGGTAVHDRETVGGEVKSRFHARASALAWGSWLSAHRASLEAPSLQAPPYGPNDCSRPLRRRPSRGLAVTRLRSRSCDPKWTARIASSRSNRCSNACRPPASSPQVGCCVQRGGSRTVFAMGTPQAPQDARQHVRCT